MQAIKRDETTAALRRIPFRVVADSDGKTELTGLSWVVEDDVIVSKNGGTEAPGGGTITEIGNGNYYYEATQSELNTLGFLLIRIENTTAGTMRPFVALAQVVAYDPNSVLMGLPLVSGPPLVYGEVVADAGNTPTSFLTDLTETEDDHWKDCLLLFQGGALSGQVKKIFAYDGTTKEITVLGGFTQVPADTDPFVIVNR